jgi:hypothetical protein
LLPKYQRKPDIQRDDASYYYDDRKERDREKGRAEDVNYSLLEQQRLPRGIRMLHIPKPTNGSLPTDTVALLV